MANHAQSEITERMSESILPNFLIVGAAKCGTTALSGLLGQHPDIFIPRIKAPRYFTGPALRNISRRDPQYDYLHQSSVLNREDYLNLFISSGNHKARGEASANYLYNHDTVIPRILGDIGDVRIVISLRNPAERALSNFYYLPKENMPLSKALAMEKVRMKNGFNSFWHYRAQGLYHNQVKAYLNNFSKVKICFFEGFVANQRRVCREIFEFLNVDADFAVDLNIRRNTTRIPRSRCWQFVLAFEKTAVVQKMILPLFGSFFRKCKKRWLVRPDYHRYPEIYNALVDDYREDIEKLEKLLSVDLNRWKKKIPQPFPSCSR
jgi:hypothetical protein